MTFNKRIPGMGVAVLASAAMLSMGGLAWLVPTASAATTTVTIPAPAISSLDPIVWGPSTLIDQGTTFEGLFGYNSKNQIVPKIADKWQMSDGGKVITVWLRHNARWSNGQPVTAEDFYYAWMRVASSNAVGDTWASVMNNVLNGYAYQAGTVPASAVGIKIVNPYELRVTLSGPSNILGLFAQSASMPVYPPDVQKHPTSWWMPQNFVGDGPYVVKSFVANGAITLVRNPDYVGHAGEYNVGNVPQIKIVPAPSVGVEDYESGALSATTITSPSDYKYVLSHMKSQVHKTPDALINYLSWDRSVAPSALNNLSVREAIAMAINRAPIVNPVLDNMVGATTVFAYPGFPTYNDEHNPYSYNVTKARQLLTKAGYPGGKGTGQLYLYCQTSTSSPQSVATAEAVAAELKQNLNLNFKIDPVNGTLWGELVYGGMQPGIHPGYTVAAGDANWNQNGQWPMQAQQFAVLNLSGAFGPQAYRQYAEGWDFYNYDPRNVKAWGNPADPNEGITAASWTPLITAAKKDIAYLNAWKAKQPAAYRIALTPPPGTPTLTQTLHTYMAEYSKAKTSAAKHTAWVDFWKWVGSYPAGGTGGANMGLNAQVYVDQHEPALEATIRMLNQELYTTASNAKAAVFASDVVDSMLNSGYVIPLDYSSTVYLARPGLEGLQANPWAEMGGFYQLQYLRLK